MKIKHRSACIICISVISCVVLLPISLSINYAKKTNGNLKRAAIESNQNIHIYNNGQNASNENSTIPAANDKPRMKTLPVPNINLLKPQTLPVPNTNSQVTVLLLS